MTMDKYLITSEEIDKLQGVEKTHFMNKNASRLNKSLGDMTGITGLGFHIIHVEPGAETSEHHRHYFEDECIYVLEGMATAFIGEESFNIKSGDFIGYRKGGEAHSIKNTGREIFKCIVVGERLAHDVGDYTRKKKRIYRNKGMMWDLVNLADIYDTKN